jgi:hypothetical protein
VHWEKTGNLYWLGHDIMFTFDVLLRAGERQFIVHGLKQVLHHLRELGLGDTPMGIRSAELLKRADVSLVEDWTSEKRLQYAQDMLELRTAIGTLASGNQPGFKGEP